MDRRLLRADTTKALILLIIPDNICSNGSTLRQDEDVLMSLTKIAQVAIMVNGPFVSYLHMISLQVLQRWSSMHNLSFIPTDISCPAVLLFDNFISPQSYHSLPLPPTS
ncbi:hypothetical protein EON65_10710, partial [archaeon]